MDLLESGGRGKQGGGHHLLAVGITYVSVVNKDCSSLCSCCCGSAATTAQRAVETTAAEKSRMFVWSGVADGLLGARRSTYFLK